MANENSIEESANDIVCQICFENKPLSKLLAKNKNKNGAKKCHKSHLYCQDCIAKHILYKIQDKIDVVQCPGDGCTVELDPMAYSSLIPRVVFVEWCDLLAESWVSKNSRRRSMCPSDACSEIVIDECTRGAVAREKCPKCKEAFCFGCGQTWNDHDMHVDCSYEDRIFIDNARNWKWQRCPKCQFFVQKTSGCNIIHCRCGNSFCYRCGYQKCRCQGQQQLQQSCFNCCFVITCLIIVFFYYLHVKRHA